MFHYDVKVDRQIDISIKYRESQKEDSNNAYERLMTEKNGAVIFDRSLNAAI